MAAPVFKTKTMKLFLYISAFVSVVCSAWLLTGALTGRITILLGLPAAAICFFAMLGCVESLKEFNDEVNN